MDDVIVEVVESVTLVTVDETPPAVIELVQDEPTVIEAIGDSTVINVEVATPATIEVVENPTTIVGVIAVGPQGPRGPAGVSGDDLSFEYSQLSALATWTIPLPEGYPRRPSVTVYLSDGEQVEADVSSSLETVTITFNQPTAGSAVIV